jgi:hypothetical protein
MDNKKILDELVARAISLTNENVAKNNTTTVISVNDKKFYEKAFSGCGSVWFELPTSQWRFAKDLGFEKGYRGYTYGSKYWNGQFGDACNAYPKALQDLRVKYPGSFLDDVGVNDYID